MTKKTMLLALAAVSAAFLAVPALASAQPAHLKEGAPAFTIAGGAGTLSRTDANSVSCTSVTGKGQFENTTTGNVTELTFKGCKNGLGFNCASTEEGHLASSQTITTTVPLPFHLIMYATDKPAILLTPNAQTAIFSHFTCLGVKVTVTGNGIIGTITAPKCNVSSATATLAFEGGAGVQNHIKYTNTDYDLHSVLGGSVATSAINTTATITFTGGNRTIECTHTT